jgi:putative membrane protein
MNFRNLIIRLAINAASLWVADLLVPGIHIGDWQALLLMSVLFAIVNAFAKPVLTFITCPLIALTLGLFLLVINTAMLGLTAWLAGQFDADVTITGFFPALFGAIIISVVSWVLSLVLE